MNNELYTQIQYRLIEQLSDSERRYRELVENLREIVFKCDREGCLNLLNKAWTATLGYEVQDCLNQSIEQFLHPEDRHHWQTILSELYAETVLTHKELRFQHQNTQAVWLELSARLKDGEITGSLTDITERKFAQSALKEANAILEEQIQKLQIEVTERQQAESTLRKSQEKLEHQTQALETAFQRLKHTQAQLVQAEKMSSLGQLVAGIAHEINNPVNFIHGNLSHAHAYAEEISTIVEFYRSRHPNLNEAVQAELEDIDIDFLLSDLPKLLSSMQIGTDRIREIVLSLRNFSRLDEAEIKAVHIHQGIDSTLMILQHRLKPTKNHRSITIHKQYSDLPKVRCYAGQLNQVFMNLLSNAIDAVEHKRGKGEAQISISTAMLESQMVEIRISDNGTGIDDETRARIFDPFFTTKPIGKGTGLGLSISYQIVVEKHQGSIHCHSQEGQGTEFVIHIPVSQTH